MNSQDQSLQAYIKAQRQSGMPTKVIRSGLVDAGWPTEVVDEALQAQVPLPPTTPSPFQAPADLAGSPIARTQMGLFNGRLGRAGMLMAFAYWVVYFIIIGLLAFAGHNNPIFNAAAILLSLPAVALGIPIGISLHIRRWHDLGQSGWLTLLSVVPGVGLIALAVLLVVPGTRGPNAYGAAAPSSLAIRTIFLGRACNRC